MVGTYTNSPPKPTRVVCIPSPVHLVIVCFQIIFGCLSLSVNSDRIHLSVSFTPNDIFTLQRHNVHTMAKHSKYTENIRNLKLCWFQSREKKLHGHIMSTIRADIHTHAKQNWSKTKIKIGELKNGRDFNYVIKHLSEDIIKKCISLTLLDECVDYGKWPGRTVRNHPKTP